MLETGLHTRASVSEHFGQCRQAFYMREKRDEAFAARAMAALARGRQVLIDAIFGATGDKAWTRFSWLLQHLHGMRTESEDAQLDLTRAKTKAMASLSAPENIHAVKEAVAEIMGRRPKAPASPPDQEGDGAAAR